MSRYVALCAAAVLTCMATTTDAAPKVVIISLDGAKPDLVEWYLLTGALDDREGLGRLRRTGVHAFENITATPSVTAVSHIAIATGSTAVHNDIPANTFHPVAATIGTSISGFGAPIGGYTVSPLGAANPPTAEPLWVKAREAGLQVVTATWPGSDGADIRIAGSLVQGAVPTRTNDYTVPFGAFGGLGAQGFTLGAANFVPAGQALLDQLTAAGHHPIGAVVTAAPIETIFCPSTPGSCALTTAPGRIAYAMNVAALDTTNDGRVNYDSLVVFDANVGVPAGPFPPPSTGSARLSPGGDSAKFYFQGSGSKIGTAYFVAALSPNLSTVKLVRYSANFIPRNAAVLADVDDANTNVGFWAPQPDFRIPERLSPGFDNYSDLELEDVYADQVKTFTEYQKAMALHAIGANPDADVVMIYFEQPDGSGHQFTMTDLRQATDPKDNTTVGLPRFPAGAKGQDLKKVLRYARYLKNAYVAANEGVEAVIDAVGVDRRGEPRSNVFVVSDHGMAPFHSAVSLTGLLAAAGLDPTLPANGIGVRTTGPATHIYLNLAGREATGTTSVPQLSDQDYLARVQAIAAALRGARDPNTFFNPLRRPLFTHVWTRPTECGHVGFCTDDNIGQDSGDVVALMAEGYNFDGTQNPVVPRLGDAAAISGIYSTPNFYGAHGHDSELRSMSAILYAAGPDIRNAKLIKRATNFDVAPTVLRILGVTPSSTVDGRVLESILD